MATTAYLNIVQSTVVTIGVVFIAINQMRNNSNTVARETAQILKDNIAAKDLEIVNMKASHEAEIKSLRTDLATTNANAEGLKQQVEMLKNLVTGHDTLTAIHKILEPVPELFKTGGYLQEIMEKQDSVLKNTDKVVSILENTKLRPVKPSHLGKPSLA